MPSQFSDHTVVVKRCESYDPSRIEAIVREGMETLQYFPAGNVYVKPNVVFAFRPEKYGGHAFTHPSLMGASLVALSRRNGVNRIDLGENTAIGMSTRMAYRHAGYYEEMRRVQKNASCPVGIFCIDEEPRDSVFAGGQVHDNLRVTRKMARSDSIVYLPKLKCQCVTRMTGAVKLNIGICSDDERAIRHDFMLNEKIADLLAVGWPDFTVMDAITVGVGNEAFPTPRHLGLIIMGRNPVAVDLVAGRLLGFHPEEIDYLRIAIDRGYTPASLDDIELSGDVTSIDMLDEYAKRVQPYDDEFFRWQDVGAELERLNSPIRFYWGPFRKGGEERCKTGCVMGLKMFLAFLERYAGPEAFSTAKPAVLLIGKYAHVIDARGSDVFMLGSCSDARIVNARKTVRIDKCFTTAGDMMQIIRGQLGIPSPITDLSTLPEYARGAISASVMKTVKGRYLQDMWHFMSKNLVRRV